MRRIHSKSRIFVESYLFNSKAISNPSAENESEAWNALCPAVLKLKEYYEFSVKLRMRLPEPF